MKTKKMKQERKEAIEKQLRALASRINDSMQQKLGNVQNTSLEDPTELLDMASDGEMDYMAAMSAETGSETIREIERALQKLDEGTYGVCEGCHNSISARRLRVRPFASLCITCKEIQERQGYVPESGDISVRGGYGMTVDLTDRDTDGFDESLDDAFRDVEQSQVY